ncbi:hypothetical protein ACIRRA_41700 [Nocardia sp. NPDC101769]|uniref:hypothetical protein n=1 Tax=Nocardia sp. NPDC101769 TaxID=3364333 RepID=UPI0037F9A5F5
MPTHPRASTLLYDGSRLDTDSGRLTRTTVAGDVLGTWSPLGDSAVVAVQMSRDGRVALLTGEGGSQLVWYPEEERAGHTLGPGPVRAAALSADGAFAVVFRSGLRLFDIRSGELFGATEHSVTNLTDIQLSDDGRVAITVERTLSTVWELAWD